MGKLISAITAWWRKRHHPSPESINVYALYEKPLSIQRSPGYFAYVQITRYR